MTLVAQVDSNVQAARQEAQSSGNGTFPPLPRGRYQAIIVPLAPSKNLPIEVTTFGGQGANKDKPMLRVAVKIVDGSPTGAGRWFAGRVPMFSRYAPNEKNPQGATARAYFDFFEKVIGLPAEVVLSGQLGIGAEHILGKPATVTLSAPKQPRDEKDRENNPLGTNEIEFWDAPGDIALTPVQAPGIPVADWLDEKGHLRPGFVFEYQKGPQGVAAGAPVAAAPPAQLWGAQPAAAPAAQAPAAAPAQPAAGGTVPGGWGAPGAPAWGAPATPPPAAPAAAAPQGDALQQAALAHATYA